MSEFPVPAVSLVEDRPATTSLAIADHFGKQHQHILRDIRSLIDECPEDFNASNFGLVEYTDSKGESRPMYHVFFDGFMLLVMGYTGSKALKMKLAYIAAFNAMRERLENQTPDSPLPPSDQNIIQALVKSIADRYPEAEQKRIYMQVWMRFRNHFRLGSYKDLPRSQMADAVAYLASLEVRQKKSLAPSYVPLSERGRDAMNQLMALRRDLSRASMEIMDVMQHATHHGKEAALDERQKHFSRELNSSVCTFFMCINHNLIAIEHMFNAFCEAEKIIYG